jgi:GntR family transcriptional regulator
MDLDVDTLSPEPVYEQIVRQIQQGVQQGTLASGTPLPSIRQLAIDLALNQNTVARAYKILETHRVIRTAGRKGTFVHSDASTHIDSRNSRDAIYKLGELVASLAEKGLSAKEIEAAFRAAMGSIRKKSAGPA